MDFRCYRRCIIIGSVSRIVSNNSVRIIRRCSTSLVEIIRKNRLLRKRFNTGICSRWINRSQWKWDRKGCCRQKWQYCRGHSLARLLPWLSRKWTPEVDRRRDSLQGIFYYSFKNWPFTWLLIPSARKRSNNLWHRRNGSYFWISSYALWSV